MNDITSLASSSSVKSVVIYEIYHVFGFVRHFVSRDISPVGKVMMKKDKG